MADYGGVPLMDFSMLGQIGQNIYDGRIRDQRRTTLESLMSPNGDVDPAALSKGAIGLLRSGDWEGGSNLLTMANSLRKTANEEAAQRAAVGLLGFGGPQQPQMQPMTVPGSGDPSVPRPLRANNPGAIDNGAFAQRQPGYTGTDGRLATFATPQAGLDAHGNLLNVYGQQGINTVSGIVGKWAPANVDNNATAEYTAYVAKRLGVDPNQPLDMLDPRVRSGLTMAMGEFESGPAKFRAAFQSVAPSGDSGASEAPQRAIPQQPAPQQPAQAPAQPQQPAVSSQPMAMPSGLSPQEEMMRRRAMATMIAPGATQGQRDAAKATLDWIMNPNRSTDLQRNYGSYVRQEIAAGRTPKSQIEYEKERAQKVDITMAAEKAFDSEAGKLTAKRYADLVDDTTSAKQMISDIETLVSLAGQINTGKEAELKAAFGPWAEYLGIKVDKLSEVQVFDALVNRLAPGMRVKGSGAQSDMELRNFLKSLLTLAGRPEANAMVGRILTGMYQNKIEAGKIGSMALHKQITGPEADRMLRELPDPMEEYRQYVKDNPGASVVPAAGGGWTVIDGVKVREKK